MTTQSTVRPLCEAPPDLRVEALSLPWLHGDVARERVEQTEVLLGAVTDLPVEVANNHVLEQAASLDLGAIVGDATGSQHGYARGNPLADLFIDVLDLGEERVTAFGDDVGGSPEGEVAGGTQQLPGSLVAQRRVDPVPGRGREDEIKPIAGRWLPGLEGPLMTSTNGKAARLLRATAARFGPISTQVIPKPRRASGSVAFPVAQPTSKSRSPTRTPATSTRVS